MAGPISGPGVGLPPPQNLYPTQLYNAPADASSNYIGLAGGDIFTVPAGVWYIDPGKYSFLQFNDPVTGIWRTYNTARGQLSYVKSDGFNFRVANLTGCPVAAIVVAGGSAYVQGTTTVTPSTGNSTWQAIVGGMLSVVSVANAGANYGIAPLVFIPPPPPPGVQATGYTSTTNGTVSGVTLTNVGAGYKSNPVCQIVPSPFDPNLNSGITTASVVINLNTSTTLASALAAVLCTNPGAPTTSLPTLTVTGAGTLASVVAVTCSSLLNATITGNGGGYATSNTELISTGGTPSGTPAYVNPAIQLTAATPRPAMALLTSGSASTTITSLGTILDGGLFFGTAGFAIVTSGIPTTAATLTIGQGTTQDTMCIQAAP